MKGQESEQEFEQNLKKKRWKEMKGKETEIKWKEIKRILKGNWKGMKTIWKEMKGS